MKAWDFDSKKYRAIKLLRQSHPKYEEGLQYFQNEVHPRVTSLNHPNIIKVLGYSKDPQDWVNLEGKKEKVMFIAMELAEKGCLFNWVNIMTMPEPEARYIMRSLLEAVSYTHSKGIVNRDLKMENVLITKDCRILICDYGYSRE